MHLLVRLDDNRGGAELGHPDGSDQEGQRKRTAEDHRELRSVLKMLAPSSYAGLQIVCHEGIFPSPSVRTIHRRDNLNLNAQQKIRLGTCAWSYEEWSGAFYPADLPSDRWLEFYARYFPAVEIDSTFYHAPSESSVLRWIESTPASFRFTCKLPRSITHACKLRDCAPELNEFLTAIEPLAAKLSVILIQLPPSFAAKEGQPILRKFIEQLPRDYRFAIEFRHPGWHKPQVVRLLEKHRICWVWADTSPLHERNLAPFELWPQTTDFIYVRLLGDYSTKYDGDGRHMHRYGKLLWKREAA